MSKKILVTESSTKGRKDSSRKYKCPYCSYRDTRLKLVDHIDEQHEEMIPKDYTSARLVFNIINRKEKGSCPICKGETVWNEKTWRYEPYCGPKCRKEAGVRAKQNMVNKYGKEHLLDDPDYQNKMLKGRSISGEYKFTDGGKLSYVGSYEKKLLEFLDKVMGYRSDEVQSPGPTIEYEYQGQKHFWITDQYLAPYNLVFDCKDGGDNPNTREMPEYRAKQEAKEAAIKAGGKYNYIRLTNNDFSQLLLILAELKEQLMDLTDDKDPIIRVNENTIVTESSIDETEEEYVINFDEWRYKEGSNILFVTGLSGSGKSTLARELCEKTDDCYILELDKLEHFDRNVEVVDGLQFNELLLHGQENLEAIMHDDDFEGVVLPEFIRTMHFLLDILYKNGDKKFIVEGIHIYEAFDTDFFVGKPVIIKKTGKLKSLFRRIEREDISQKELFKGIIKDAKPLLRWYNVSDKQLKEFTKGLKLQFVESVVYDTTVDYSPIKNKHYDGLDSYCEAVIGVMKENKKPNFVVPFILNNTFSMGFGITDDPTLEHVLISDNEGNIKVKGQKFFEEQCENYLQFQYKGDMFVKRPDFTPANILEAAIGKRVLSADQLLYDSDFVQIPTLKETCEAAQEILEQSLKGDNQFRIGYMNESTMDHTELMFYQDGKGFFAENTRTKLRTPSYSTVDEIPGSMINYLNNL